MTEPTGHSQQLLLPRFFQELSARGWPLGRNVTKQPPVQVLENLIHCTLHEESNKHRLPPLPLWLLEVFRDKDQQEVRNNPHKLIVSYLTFSETYFDILDSMALWLDYDACVKAGEGRLFDRLKSRQYELRENSYHTLLSQQDSIGKMDNLLLRRTERFNDLPLRQRLQFLGTIACENLATSAIRDAVHEQLCLRYKTDAIPNAFLEYFESVQNDPFFCHAIIISGFFTLTMSIRDYLAGLRKTTMTQDAVTNLEQGSVEQIVNFIRNSFVQGLSLHSPASHFRLEKIDLAEPIIKIALHFWQNKLRDARMHQEKQRATGRKSHTTCSKTHRERAMDFHTSLVLGKIPPGSVASLELMNPRNRFKCSLTSYVLGLKDSQLLLAIQSSDAARSQIAPKEAFTLRFAVGTRSPRAQVLRLPMHHASHSRRGWRAVRCVGGAGFHDHSHGAQIPSCCARRSALARSSPAHQTGVIA